MLSDSSAKELQAIITANTAVTLPGGTQGAPLDFCEIWPTAKPILQMIAGIAPFIPGVGVAAGGTISALTAVGQAFFDKECGSGSSNP
jgi:hypothetical protein